MIEEKDLVAGARVAKNFDRFNPWEEIQRGKVLMSEKDPITGKTKVLVKWDSNYQNVSEVFADQLLTEAEAETLGSKLEAEYKEVEKQLSEKMGQAAQIIREAQKIAQTIKADLAGMGNITRDLYRAMDEAGWSTSSFHC
jgi:prophage DNA circulation protein